MGVISGDRVRLLFYIMKKVNQTFKKERKETDDSLLKERGKTDVSFDKGRQRGLQQYRRNSFKRFDLKRIQTD